MRYLLTIILISLFILFPDARASNKIISNNLNIFEGPIVDREGKTRLSKGQLPSENWLANMNFYVPGVQGSLPKN